MARTTSLLALFSTFILSNAANPTYSVFHLKASAPGQPFDGQLLYGIDPTNSSTNVTIGDWATPHSDPTQWILARTSAAHDSRTPKSVLTAQFNNTNARTNGPSLSLTTGYVAIKNDVLVLQSFVTDGMSTAAFADFVTNPTNTTDASSSVQIQPLATAPVVGDKEAVKASSGSSSSSKSSSTSTKKRSSTTSSSHTIPSSTSTSSSPTATYPGTPPGTNKPITLGRNKTFYACALTSTIQVTSTPSVVPDSPARGFRGMPAPPPPQPQPTVSNQVIVNYQVGVGNVTLVGGTQRAPGFSPDCVPFTPVVVDEQVFNITGPAGPWSGAGEGGLKERRDDASVGRARRWARFDVEIVLL